MRALSPFLRSPRRRTRVGRVAQFESRPTLTGQQLLCRACGSYTIVGSRAEGEAWALRGCPHTSAPAPAGGLPDLLAKATPGTPPGGFTVELRRAAGLR